MSTGRCGRGADFCLKVINDAFGRSMLSFKLCAFSVDDRPVLASSDVEAMLAKAAFENDACHPVAAIRQRFPIGAPGQQPPYSQVAQNGHPMVLSIPRCRYM